MRKFREMKETHMQGSISFENMEMMHSATGDLGIQIAEDGRVWICVNGIAAIRFMPEKKKKKKKGGSQMNFHDTRQEMDCQNCICYYTNWPEAVEEDMEAAPGEDCSNSMDTLSTDKCPCWQGADG